VAYALLLTSRIINVTQRNANNRAGAQRINGSAWRMTCYCYEHGGGSVSGVMASRIKINGVKATARGSSKAKAATMASAAAK